MTPKNVQMPNPNSKYKPPGTPTGGRGGHTMKCRKCGSGNMGVMPNKKNPSATDLYCLDCGAWQKFATKDEIRLYQCKKGPITNADRIRAMSDEELAEELVIEIEGLFPSLVYVPMATGNIYISRDKAEKEMLEYLQQPAEEES